MTTPSSPPPLQPDDGTWLRGLRAEVQPMTFKKGREYAESRRVSGLVRTEVGIAATVGGSEGEAYDVQVAPADDGGLESRCTCVSWGKYGPHCKHVVAVALVYLARLRAAALARGDAVPKGPWLDAAPRGASPERSAPGRGGKASASVAGSSGSSGSSGEIVRERVDGGELQGMPALNKVESWLGLSALPDLEFVYRLTPSLGQGGARLWVIEARRADQSAKGPVQIRRLLSTGARLAPADERVFGVLARFEARYDAKLLLNDEDLTEALDVLRLRRVIYRGTPLVFGPEPARPVVRLQSRPDGSSARLELMLPEGQTVQLKEAVVVCGRRSWLFVGQQAYVLEPDFPPRLLRKWLLEPSMTFASDQLDRVLSFFAAHLPRFRLSLLAEGIEVDDAAEPRFLLTVEGRADAVRAQLVARYGHGVTVPVSPVAQHLGYAAGGVGAARRLVLRREALEREAGRRLLELGFRFDEATASYEGLGDTAIAFWTQGRAALPASWEVYAATAPAVRLRSRLRPRVRVSMPGASWFDLEAEFVSEDQHLDLGAVRLFLESNRRFVPLRDGSFAEVDRGELERVADLLEEAGALPGTPTTRLPLFHATALDFLASVGDVEIEAKARRAITELKEIDGIPPVRAPDALRAQLRHYQEGGLSWLWFLYRHGLSGVLADDMGLGKTVQALAFLLKVKAEQGAGPALVVAPTSVLPNWEREIERFAPTLAAVTWHGADRHESFERLRDVDVVLTSYALVRRDVTALSKIPYRTVILDEAQNIKNADSATAQACKSIAAEHRLALTGTPLENRLTELWSIFDFLMPGFLSTADGFVDRFERPITVEGDGAVRERLKRRIHPFVLRRLKTEVAKDLPPKTEVVTWVDMEPGQAALYREVLEESRRKVYESIDRVGFGRSRMSILSALMRLRQVCCDPRLLKMPPDVLPPSAKLDRFGELVEELVREGHRALVFSQFTEMLALLRQQTEERQVPSLYLDGHTKDRMARVDAFNAPDGPPLFFISLKAGGTGLNLTAADYVIHYDPWWNPAVEDQATDRTHRIGQTRAVFAYKLITRGTVEEKILALQQRKRELVAGVLGTDAEMGKSLTESDVADLLRFDP